MKAVCMMTGAVLALGTVVPQMSQAVPEAVREEAPRIQVSSTDEFIKVFLTEKLIGRDGKETSRQIETVSETNYASVLAGRDFLKSRSETEKNHRRWSGTEKDRLEGLV